MKPRKQRLTRYKRIAWEQGIVSMPRVSIRYAPYRHAMIQRRKKTASVFKGERRRGFI